MIRLSTALSATALAFTSLVLSAEDFRPLMQATQATWPTKQHIGVICNFRSEQAKVLALAKAAGEGALITVVDARMADEANMAATLLANKKADYVVLLPQDRLFGDGSYAATVALQQLARRGVPAIATTARALKQGAVFSVGEGTAGQLLVTDRLIGTISVILPDRSKVAGQANFIRQEGMATIAVHAAR